MKPLHVRDLPILFFKNECNKINLEKTVLDCGAGGRRPPLALFYNDGYKTAGIEILDSQIEMKTVANLGQVCIAKLISIFHCSKNSYF